MNGDLHWSFDYTRFNGDAFRDELIGALEAVYVGGIPTEPASAYIVLPNYWRGYQGRGPGASGDKELAFGRVSIQRAVTDSAIAWRVESCHDASGERLELRFQTDASPLRRLQGEWRIDASNCAEGEYNEFHAEGRLDDSRQIHLAVGDISFVAGELEDDRPLLCDWTLFDVVPELARLPEGAEFALLDDLEKLKPRCRVRPLDTSSLPLAGGALDLRGFVVFGEAQVPCHYWLDANDNVAIASSTFHTLILRSAEGGS